jgi:hypothetical protein
VHIYAKLLLSLAENKLWREREQKLSALIHLNSQQQTNTHKHKPIANILPLSARDKRAAARGGATALTTPVQSTIRKRALPAVVPEADASVNQK